MAAAVLITGCGKKQETAAPVVPQQVQSAQPPAAAPAPVAPAAVSNSKTNTGPNVDLTALSYAMRPWAMSHGRWPKNFEEFAADPGPGIVIPPPPPGKKYQINNKGRIVLVNR